jgi:hypothetical protein
VQSITGAPGEAAKPRQKIEVDPTWPYGEKSPLSDWEHHSTRPAHEYPQKGRAITPQIQLESLIVPG